jgi:hypothetical protein
LRKSLRYGLVAVLLLVAGGIVAPYIGADRYKVQIRDGLQRALHRKVDIGETHLNLFRGPGFSVERVIIHDDPSAGIEPLASVPELQATISLMSLLKGRLEFATVRFVEPHLSIVKPDDGAWNVIGLLAGAAASSGSNIPEIQVSDGRINFKFGEVKSSFYLTDTDLTVSPARGGFEITFSCAPARTDRSGQGYGFFSGRGNVSNGDIDLDVQLERSPIEELVTLVRGQSLGLHGMIVSVAKVSGPLKAPRIMGRFELDDVHRWDLIPGSAGKWSMAYSGTLDIPDQRFELIADHTKNPRVPIELKLSVEQALTQPDWRVEAAIERLPASGLIEFARHMGAPLPQGIVTGGDVEGSVSYGSSSGMDGKLRIANASIVIDRGAQFSLPEADLVIEGDEARLLRAEISGSGNQAQLELRYAPFRQRLEARLSGKGLRTADLQEGTGHLLNGAAVPLVDRFRGGTWSGAVHYLATGDEPGAWTADVQLRDTSTSVPGFAAPIKIAAADVSTDGANITVHRMRGSAGDIEFYGDYSYEPKRSRPHQFTFTVPVADTADIENLLMASLHRSGGGFIARTLRWRSPLPEWLRERRAIGQLRIGTLTSGDLRLRAVRSRVIWTAGSVELADFEARLEEAFIAGRFIADLTQPGPRYTLSGTVQDLLWKSGHLDLEGTIETEGIGLDVLANLTADGRFQARSLALVPDLSLRTMSGSFGIAPSANGPLIRLSELEAAVGAERFNGAGSTQPDGRLQVDLASASRSVRMSGPIAAMKLEVTSDRQTAR